MMATLALLNHMAHIIITIAKNMIIYPQNYGNVDIDS